ncbi:MAG: class I SAM-dependent methyltransferase [Pseudomonadota bacterium]
MNEVSPPALRQDLQTVRDAVDRCIGHWDAAGDARRLFHGRGRLYPGLEQVCVDGFPPLVLVTFFRAPEPGVEQALLDGLRTGLAGRGMQCLAVQRRYVVEGGNEHEPRPEVIAGELPAQPAARENGLRFRIDTERGQNLGFFLDMRLAREWLRARAAGRSVLNLFAFTCAFSVAARAGGAGRIVNIDLSRPSLTLGRENHRLNGQGTDDIHFLDHDIFRSWNKLHRLGRYDLIVMDPPTMQKGSFVAERDYGKVVRRFSKLLKPESDVLACLNAPHLGADFLDDVFARELPGAEKVARLPNPPEFADADPGAGLKVVHYRYRRPADLPPLDAADNDMK